MLIETRQPFCFHPKESDFEISSPLTVKTLVDSLTSKKIKPLPGAPAVDIALYFATGFFLAYSITQYTDPVLKPASMYSYSTFAIDVLVEYPECRSTIKIPAFEPHYPAAIFPIFVGLIAVVYILAKQLFRIDRNHQVSFKNEEIDTMIEQLPANLDAEVTPEHIVLIFPFLNPSVLYRLNFAMLKEARKNHTTLFRKHLDDGSYSPTQLAMWRLFDHLVAADSEEQKEILSHKMSQHIISYDSLFFEKVVKNLRIIDNETIKICKTILKKIVIEKGILLQSHHSLKFIILSLASGVKLDDFAVRKIVYEQNSENSSDSDIEILVQSD